MNFINSVNHTAFYAYSNRATSFQVMSQRSQYATFFFQLADLGCTLQHSQLRDGARNLLQLVPPDTFTVTRLQWLFGHYKDDEALQNPSQYHCNEQNTTVDSLFFTASPSQVLYNLEVSVYKIALNKF